MYAALAIIRWHRHIPLQLKAQGVCSRSIVGIYQDDSTEYVIFSYLQLEFKSLYPPQFPKNHYLQLLKSILYRLTRHRISNDYSYVVDARLR